jgi:hypothetical protein
MAFDFPNAPTIGQVYQGWTWDGEKWDSAAGYGPIYVADTPPTAPVGSLWLNSATGVLFCRYNDGNSEQWITVLGGAGYDAVLHSTAQALIDAQQVQARKNVYAAPFDAMGYSGIQVNGAMEVSQEFGNNIGTPATTTYPVDNWSTSNAQITGDVLTGQHVDTVPPGYKASLVVYAGSVLPTGPADAFINFLTRVEGTRAARLAWGTVNAQPVTIGFWALSNIEGVASIAIRNSATNRSYVTTASVRNAWQFITFTVPPDTSGTWLKDTGIGIYLTIGAYAPTGVYTAPVLNAWQAGNYFNAAGQSNFLSATNCGMYISGLVILPGIETPSAARAPFTTRPFDQELQLCRRYWRKNSTTLAVFGAATQVNTAETFSPVMRAAPTAALFSNGVGAINDLYSAMRDITVVGGNTYPDGAQITCTSTTSGVVNKVVVFNPGHVSYNARL